MSDAAFTTRANAVRKSIFTALLTFHGSIHVECAQSTSDHCAVIKSHGVVRTNAG
jgi:hypothetical protein